MSRSRGERGATAVEYGLIVACIVTAVVLLPLIAQAMGGGFTQCTIEGLRQHATPAACKNSPYM